MRFGRNEILIVLLAISLLGRCEAANETGHQEKVSVSIVGLNWHHVQGPYLVSVWIIVCSVAKICFHINEKFGEAIPDSALLIGVGLVLGFILNTFKVNHDVFYLPSDIFFLYLLPPIIFDAGYFMPNRQLFDNFGSVMMFAVIGTIFNTVAIGATLAICARYGFFTVKVSIEDALLFSSLISAVDPVAVITVFEELHVNEFLFINVFGEALFNDGIAAVLFQIFKRVALIEIPNLKPLDYVSFTGSFFFVALGGVLIGVIFAFICAIATRYTERVMTVGPVFVFILPYLSYLTAEMFGLSAILAICTCGIIMKQYVKGNITHEAASSVKYFVKMLAQSSETAVFMFLGLSTMSSDLQWDLWFIIVTMFSCLVYRALGVVLQCAFLNLFRTKRFTFRDQFVMAYGGLRGAIAFGLLSSVPSSIPAKDVFTSTTLVVILFTVFIQGTTIRPILYLLKVETKEGREETMTENVFNKYFDYIMAGIEDITDQHSAHSFRDWFERFNAKILKPFFMRNAKSSHYDASAIIRAYQKIAIQDALNMITVDESKTSARNSEIALDDKANGTGFVSVNLNGDNSSISNGSKSRAKLFDIDQRLADFRHEPVDSDVVDDIPDEFRPNARRRAPIYGQPGQSIFMLPGMNSESTAGDTNRRRRSSQMSNQYRIRPTNQNSEKTQGETRF